MANIKGRHNRPFLRHFACMMPPLYRFSYNAASSPLRHGKKHAAYLFIYHKISIIPNILLQKFQK
jgi:hypothetical protein